MLNASVVLDVTSLQRDPKYKQPFLLLGTQFEGYDESISDYVDGCCFSLVRQLRDVGSNLLSKVQ
jgi:hypothetical protein